MDPLDPASPIPGDARTAYTWDDPTLLRHLLKWQTILGLADWDLKIRWARYTELEDGTKGSVSFVTEKRSGIIRVLRPDDYDYDIPWDQDVEETVVHELLHLVWDPFEPDDRGSLEYKLAHQALDRISTTLVRLDRR